MSSFSPFKEQLLMNKPRQQTDKGQCSGFRNFMLRKATGACVFLFKPVAYHWLIPAAPSSYAKRYKKIEYTALLADSIDAYQQFPAEAQ